MIQLLSSQLGSHLKRWFAQQRWVHYVALAAVMTLLALFFHVQHWRWADALDNLMLDTSFHLRKPASPVEIAEQNPATRDIIIVELPHPVPQPLLAELLLLLRQAKVVALDLMIVDQAAELQDGEKEWYADEMGQWSRNNATLEAAIHQAGNVILGSWTDEVWVAAPHHPEQFTRALIWQHPQTTLWQQAQYHAHLSVQPDAQDHIVRHVPLFWDVEDFPVTDQASGTHTITRLPCLGLAVAAAAHGIRPAQLQALLQRLPAGGGILHLGTARIPYDENGMLTIDYVGDHRCFEYGSNRIVYHRILELYEPADFKDKLILIGGTDVKGKDFFPTPHGTMAGIQIHANIVATLQRVRAVPWLLSPWLLGLFTLFCCAVPILTLLRWPFWSSILIATVEIVLVMLFGAWLYTRVNTHIAVSVPITAIILTYNAVMLYEFGRIRATLGRFVGKDMLKRTLYHFTHLHLGRGSVEEASAMFCDLRGYSTLSETLPPETVATIVNDYTEMVVSTITRFQGRPVDFVGDGVFVLFEVALAGKQYPLRAVEASDALIKGFIRLREKWVAQGIPNLHVGIAIHTGSMMIGLLGSQHFLKMGAVGDVVNVAARVQGLSTECGYDVLLTQETYDRLPDKTVAEYCGVFLVRGRKQPVSVYGLAASRQPLTLGASCIPIQPDPA